MLYVRSGYIGCRIGEDESNQPAEPYDRSWSEESGNQFPGLAETHNNGPRIWHSARYLMMSSSSTVSTLYLPIGISSESLDSVQPAALPLWPLSL